MPETASPDNEAPKPYKGDYVRFKPPSTFSAPTVTDEGKTFSVVCDFKPDADGYITMVMLGETAMPDSDEKGEKKGEKPKRGDYMEDASGIVNDLRSSGAMSTALG